MSSKQELEIPVLIGACECCKNEPICKYAEELKGVAFQVQQYSNTTKPYRITIKCGRFENASLGGNETCHR